MKGLSLKSASALILLTSMSSAPPQNTLSTAYATVDFRERDPSLIQYGAVNAAARWDRNSISVCWLDHPEFAAERDLVQQAINSTWTKSSSLIFTGWGNCTQKGADVQIQVADDPSAPRSYVGKNVIGRSPSMWLNFTFKLWGKTCQGTRTACIKAIAAHEFGHAVGFEHEQLQSDAPKACVDHLKKDRSWEVLDHKIDALTPYDPDSIMNYCNSIWLNNGSLSSNDKKAILILFPRA
ncbi:MAG: M57 family metalloprotease [Acidobacteriota bacterium]|nr:M57 family metalloprotease [Acidobacteriota bacterium]